MPWAFAELISIPCKVQKGNFFFQSERRERKQGNHCFVLVIPRKRYQSHLHQKVTRWPPQVALTPATGLECSEVRPQPARGCDSHFQPEAKMLPGGGEYGIIPSRLLWETRFSDQETRCLKQTKNALQSEWKSMRDNV